MCIVFFNTIQKNELKPMKAANDEDFLYFIFVSSMIDFLFSFLYLEGQQNIAFLELFELAINILDHKFIDKNE
jgi:hypothetical protein